MEVKYKRDLYASYMLIKIPEEAERESYSFKMLQENRMKNILSCKERIEDGVSYLYIDISGKKNLMQEFQEQKMELEDMAGIFQQIVPALEELRDYLLTEKMAVLEPEFIYRDLEDGNLFLTLLPWEQGDGNNLHKLAEFFLEKMNQRDEHGVNAAYHFYRQQAQPQFSLFHFLPVLEKESILKRQKISETKAGKPKNYLPEYREDSAALPEDEWKEEELLKTTEVKAEHKSKGFLRFLPFGKKKRKEKKTRGMGKEVREPEDILPRIPGGQETVFFDSVEDEDLLKLQWKERGRTRQVILKDLPCTVGKIKNEVSIVIQDMSVSRIHCRFVEKERGIGIMDLNSTNGTYLNGMKLKQGEILEIVKNDEILIGKVRALIV